MLYWKCQTIMCWETSSELMTWQHVIFILSETNVPMMVTSSILGFKGCYQFMLVSALRFIFFSPHSILSDIWQILFTVCFSWDTRISTPETLKVGRACYQLPVFLPNQFSTAKHGNESTSNGRLCVDFWLSLYYGGAVGSAFCFLSSLI